MTIQAKVECVWPERALLGEGPCWDARSGRIYWVDIKGARLHAYEVATGAQRSWSPPHRLFSLDAPPPSWIPPHDDGGDWFVGCAEIGFSWIQVRDDGVSLHVIVHPEPNRPENRFNDGKVGPEGRYWAGTMHDAEAEPTGHLYAFSANGDFECVDSGYIVSNGPAFSPDGRTLYHNDSARRRIYAFDLSANGKASNRRVFVLFADDEGYPDGMTTDRAGNLWVAMWDGARVQKLSPEGERLGHVVMPVARPTSCTFVGSDLFVTSAALGAAQSDQLAGGLFRVTPNI